MKVDLKSAESKRSISSVRSQIKDSSSLKKFDEFIAKHDSFDFNNDQDVEALKKQDCHCTVTTTIPLEP